MLLRGTADPKRKRARFPALAHLRGAHHYDQLARERCSGTWVAPKEVRQFAAHPLTQLPVRARRLPPAVLGFEIPTVANVARRCVRARVLDERRR